MHTMAEATLTIELSGKLRAAFIEAAEARSLTPRQLLRTLVEKEVASRRKVAEEHDAWFQGEVGRALREADDQRVQRIPHGLVNSLLDHASPCVGQQPESSDFDGP